MSDRALHHFLERFKFTTEDCKQHFGEWDACDPVSWAILRVVQAQNDLAHAIHLTADYGVERPRARTGDCRTHRSGRRTAGSHRRRATRFSITRRRSAEAMSRGRAFHTHPRWRLPSALPRLSDSA